MLYNIDILFSHQIPTYKPPKQVSKIATLVSHLLPLQLCDTKVPLPEKSQAGQWDTKVFPGKPFARTLLKRNLENSKSRVPVDQKS